MKKKFDYAVMIGRFQGFTKAHEENLKVALEVADRVIVVIGRTALNEDRTLKNPFTYNEREGVIYSSVPHELRHRVAIVAVTDGGTNEYWADQVRYFVRTVQICEPGAGVDGSVCLIGHKKDESSFYLDLFPEWELIDTGNPTGINATDVRLNYFSEHPGQGWMDGIPPATVEFLSRFRKTEDYYVLRGKYLFKLAELEEHGH